MEGRMISGRKGRTDDAREVEMCPGGKGRKGEVSAPVLAATCMAGIGLDRGGEGPLPPPAEPRPSGGGGAAGAAANDAAVAVAAAAVGGIGG
eukprot:1150761-Pelagomonas_calceolata.AAC.2